MTSYLELSGGYDRPQAPLGEDCSINHIRGETIAVEIPDGEIEVRYGRKLVIFQSPGGRPACIFNIVDGCLFYMSRYWVCYEIVRDFRRLGRSRIVQYAEYETRLPMRREEIPLPLLDPWTLLEPIRPVLQPANFQSITSQPPIREKVVSPKLKQTKNRAVRLREQ